MSEQIKVGDLIVVIGTYCKCQSVDIGYIAAVESLSIQGTECVVCHDVQPPKMTCEIIHRPTGRHAWKPLAIVRKIPPLSEPESTETKQEITA